MLYNLIKIFHILSATLLLTTMGYCCFIWWQMQFSHIVRVNIERIQVLTMQVIVPFALVQLISGFTLISLKPEYLPQLWVKASGLGFVIVIASWFAFLYFLLSGKRRSQSLILFITALGLLFMIFFMVNKI